MTEVFSDNADIETSNNDDRLVLFVFLTHVNNCNRPQAFTHQTERYRERYENNFEAKQLIYTIPIIVHQTHTFIFG